MAIVQTTHAQGNNPLFYIDSLTKVLKKQELGSQEQSKTIFDLMSKIRLSLADDSLTQEEKNRFMEIMRELLSTSGEYSFLNPNFKPDTLNLEVVMLGKQLRQFQDSISEIQSKLIEIIENEHQSDSTREGAVQILASIHKEEVLKYLFENEQTLRFGPYNPYDDTDESYRTALSCVLKAYTFTGNWMVFPYLLQNLNKLGFLEITMIRNLLIFPTKYKSPWLLLEFMYENASPETKPVIREFILDFDEFKKPNK